jgi:peptide subunit release factor 1 (eRF1)
MRRVVAAILARGLTVVKSARTITRRRVQRPFRPVDYRIWRKRMALKKPYVLELTEELDGDDARRLIEYVRDPNPPEGHDEYLDHCDRTFEALYSPRTANELFS